MAEVALPARSAAGVGLCIISSSASLALLFSSVTLRLISDQQKDAKAHNGWEVTWIALSFVVSTVICSVVYLKYIKGKVAEWNALPPDLERERLFSTVKVFCDFFVGAGMLIWGVNHPNSAHGLSHGWALIVVGSSAVLGSSILGLYWVVRTIEDGFSIFSAAITQVVIFYASDKLWFASGWIMVFYFLVFISYLEFAYNRRNPTPFHLRALYLVFIVVCDIAICLCYWAIGSAFLRKLNPHHIGAAS